MNEVPKPLGEVAKQKGILTDDQLKKTLALQKDIYDQLGKAIRIGKIIIEQGYATEKDLVKAINDHYGLSIQSLTDDFEPLIKVNKKGVLKRLLSPKVPIWLRLSFSFVLIITMVSFLFGFFIVKHQNKQLYDQALQMGRLSLDFYVNNARIPLIEKNTLRLNTLIHQATNMHGIVYAAIVDNQNKILAHTSSEKINQKYNTMAEKSQIVREDDVVYFICQEQPGVKILNISRPVEFQNKRLGEIHVGLSIESVERSIKQERQYITIITVMIALMGVVIAIFISMGLSRPISKLLTATQEIRKGNYQHQVIFNPHDEFGDLAKSFNEMAEELRLKSLIQESLGKYVGPEILSMIVANPEGAWLKIIKGKP